MYTSVNINQTYMQPELEVEEGVVEVVEVVVEVVVGVKEEEEEGQAIDSSPMCAAANRISDRVLALSSVVVPVGRP